MAELVRVEVADRVATVSLNRPEKLNALSQEMFEALAEAGRRVEHDPGIRAVLLRGEGRAFCSGLDTSSFGGLGGDAPGGSGGERSEPPIHVEGRGHADGGGPPERTGPVAVAERIARAQEGFTCWARMAKPVVAAVHGYALGGGIQLALAADIRIAAEGTVLSVFEITYGLVPDLGATHHLPRLTGPALAKELTWTARKFTAEEGAEWGIVNRVVPADQLEKVAGELVAELASKPPMPVAFVKRLIDEGHQLSLEENMRRVAQAQATCILSNDVREAVAAAFEKRQGSYSGT